MYVYKSSLIRTLLEKLFKSLSRFPNQRIVMFTRTVSLYRKAGKSHPQKIEMNFCLKNNNFSYLKLSWYAA